MLITQVKPLDKQKSKVIIDYDISFVLYNRELRLYKIAEGNEIEEDVYFQIISNVLPKRCLKRAGFILEKSDKTSKELRDKLVLAGYPEDIVEATIDKLISYGYIDDERYTKNYIRYHIKNKNFNKIKTYLMGKGINNQMIQDSFEEIEKELNEDGDSIKDIQMNLIKKEMLKKKILEKTDKKDISKIIMQIVMKGYKYDMVNEVYERLKS
ncbi:RecX family protein [Lachnospiraceae bacterium RM5]|nr:RecX family protein [Lachnospiraceae bacterium RM5]